MYITRIYNFNVVKTGPGLNCTKQNCMRLLNCTRWLNCTGAQNLKKILLHEHKFARGHKITRKEKMHEDYFARRVKFARVTILRGHDFAQNKCNFIFVQFCALMQKWLRAKVSSFNFVHSCNFSHCAILYNRAILTATPSI